MSEITFEQPEISGAPNAPVSLENKSFPYNQLADSRRYEELIYSIFRQRIKVNDFSPYTRISLMNGVRDKGRDCTLYTGNSFTGLIQCKKYSSPLKKSQFGDELVKFLLYSLVYEELKFDRRRFTYFIAVSSGFSNDCSDFIDQIQDEIINESNLDSWIQKHLKNPIFSDVNFDKSKTYIIDTLEKIAIEKIYPEDLDNFLIQKECNSLIPLFFQIRSVVETKEVTKLAEKFDQIIGCQLERDEIKQQLSLGSNSLKLEQNDFDEIPDSHIPRDETNKLLNWIESPLNGLDKNKIHNICILAGDAGMGKTVILKDLFEALNQKDIPVLGLKTDKLYVSSMKELQQNVGLSLPVFDFIKACEDEFPLTVLILDQLDALSQSMSSERSYLMVFKSLIDYFTHRPNIRIILSVRLKDLKYDPTLKSYQHITHITVNLLTEDQVLNQLAKIGVLKEQLSKRLLELLRVPHHLNIFSRIAKKSNNFNGINSIHDLYSELWKQQVILKPNVLKFKQKRIRKVLYKMVDHFYKNQKTEVHINRFEDYSRELAYLESEHLIKKEDEKLQLFHQTFYDFIFAKKFVENQKNLLNYIFEQEQSLFIRSAVKMIINYLREFDLQDYHRTIRVILQDTKILFHVKHMIISQIAFQEFPTKEEANLVFRISDDSISLRILFFELARADKWLDYTLNNNYLIHLEDLSSNFQSSENDREKNNKRYLYNISVDFLLHFLIKGNIEAWKFLNNRASIEVKKQIVYKWDDWLDTRAYKLFQECLPMNFKDYTYQSVLSKLVEVRPKFVWNQLKVVFLSDVYLEKAYPHDYTLMNTLKSLAKRIPEILIPDLEEKVCYDLENPKDQDDDDFLSYFKPYEGIDLKVSEDHTGKAAVYEILAECLTEVADNNEEVYLGFVAKYSSSSHYPLLNLILHSLGRKGCKYPDEVIQLMKNFEEKDLLDFHAKPGKDFRILLGETFSCFTSSQKRVCLQIIKNLKIPSESFVMKRGDNSFYPKTWGLSKLALLTYIPSKFIDDDPDLKRNYLELQRKFPDFKDDSSQQVMAGVVQRPLHQAAYENMTKSQWLKSFIKYDSERTRFAEDFLKGGLHEHSWAFREAVKNDPSIEKISIIEKSIGQEEIDSSYPILGLCGLCEAIGEPETVKTLFKRIIAIGDYNNRIMDCIRIASYLIENEHADRDIYDFLFKISKNTPIESTKRLRDPLKKSSINGLVTQGINSVHGSIAQAFTFCSDKAMENDVFEFLEGILRSHNGSTKAALLFRYAHLMNLNKERTFNLYVKYMSKEDDVFVLASSLVALNYLANYNFDEILPIIKRIVRSKKIGGEDTRILFDILLRGTIQSKNEAENQLFKLLETNIEARNASFYKIKSYLKESLISKELANKILLFSLANISKEEYTHRRRYFFSKLEGVSLEDLYPFLQKYVQSKEFQPSDGFISYLLKECRNTPEKAIKLFKSSLQHNQEFDSDYFILGNNTLITKFIVGAFHSLNETNSEIKKLRFELLEILDFILQDTRYWNKNLRVLEELN